MAPATRLIRAAGVLYLTEDGQALFLKRGNGSDHPGEWCFPGGQVEEGETFEVAAAREAREEAGADVPAPDLKLLCRRIGNAEVAGGASSAQLPAEPGINPAAPNLPPTDAGVVPGVQVDFATFIQRVKEPFPVEICDESTGYAWAKIETPPEPLHPGCHTALARLSMDELGVARAMAAGELTSPHRYGNITFFAIRITGTGVAYRSGRKEFVWRDPSIYLNPEFLARCSGLPVIWVHPPKKPVLDSEEFGKRIIGTIMLAFIKGDEVWGIARVYDDEAIEAMIDMDLSTSPGVVLSAKEQSRMTLEDGSALLIEGKPSLLDHIAICPLGVWDKGGEPSGIIVNDSAGDHVMTEEERKAAEAAADKARKDAEEKAETERADRARKDAENGQKLDKLLSGLDSMGSRIDAVCARMDAVEAADKARKDAAEGATAPEQVAADKARKDETEDERKEREKAEAEKDKARKDAEEKEVKEREDAARKDSEDVRRRIADIEAKLPKQRSDADFAAMAEAQARADSVFSAFGDSAPRPLDGEDLSAYRRRLASGLKAHSPRWKDQDLLAVNDGVLTIAEDDIYADAATAARRPVDLEPGVLRPVRRRDPETGLQITDFVGSTTFISQMRRPGARARILDSRKAS